MARDFSGTNQYINWGDHTLFDGLTAFTMAAWVNPDTWSIPDGTTSVIRKDGTLTALQNYDGLGNACAIWDNGGTLHEFFNNSPAIGTGTWHLYMVRWSISNNSGVPQYSYDGGSWTAFNNNDSGVTDNIYGSGSVTMRFGATEGAAEDYNGKLAEVAFWNTRLGDSTPATLYTSSETGNSPLFIPTGLIFYSRLTGDTSPEPDEIGALSGTVTGATQSTHPTITYPSATAIKDIIGSGVIPFPR